MALTKEQAVATARKDLAQRLGVNEAAISDSTEDAEFPDMALGAGLPEEMSGQMITPGWRIRLQANGKSFEYRANKNQIRLCNYNGQNHRL